MGILIAADTVGIGCAGWVLRSIVGEIAGVLQERGYAELAAWLTDELSPPSLYADLDAREFVPNLQGAFLDTIAPAFVRAVQRGPEGWNDPSAWTGYAQLFRSLAEQAESLAQGRPASKWPNLSYIGPPSGRRVVQDGPRRTECLAHVVGPCTAYLVAGSGR
jgi:hypothetical protein